MFLRVRSEMDSRSATSRFGQAVSDQLGNLALPPTQGIA